MLIMTLKNYRFIFLFLIISMLTPNAFALDLSSTITSSSNRVQSGASVTYTGTVSNNSTTSATNSQLIFYMPPRNVNYISLPVGCTIKVKITCLLGDLLGGASVSKSITVSYSSSGSAIVSALAVTESADSNINNNASRLITNVTKSSTNSVTIPLISSVNPSPVSVTMGNSINFSASLSGNLPSGYSVKLNYSNSSIPMSGSGTSFSTVQAPTQIGQQVFSVGIYDANNILKSNSMTGNFEIVKANTFPTLSFMSGNSTATVGTSYSVQLQGNDSDNNLSLITINWGDGSSNSQNASNGSTLTFSHTYSSANSFTWSATALDSANASSSAVSKTVTVSAAVVTPPVSTSGYTKISNTGSTLPDSAVLGSGSNDWACTKDNKTGLIWEVKTTDGGIRDWSINYSNYFLGDSDFGGIKNSDYFAGIVNKQTLCGGSNWRLPTNEELKSIVVCSDGKYNLLAENIEGYICTNSNLGLVKRPTVNATYFPNTQSDATWSSSPYSSINNSKSWFVNFSNGTSYGNIKPALSAVRLVRDKQSTPILAYTKISNSGGDLPETAVLGSGPNDWACTKDNKTGLIWEVKTTDGGLRDWKNTYKNYLGLETYLGGANNSNTFVSSVNAQNLCGSANWRLPTNEELKGLVSCSDSEYITFGNVEGFICSNFNTITRPSINAIFFPNTVQDYYWTSLLFNDYIVWGVYFGNGYSSGIGKGYNYYLRLVRQ